MKIGTASKLAQGQGGDGSELELTGRWSNQFGRQRVIKTYRVSAAES